MIPNSSLVRKSRRHPTRTTSLEGLPWPSAAGKHLRLAALSPEHHEEFLRRKAARRAEECAFLEWVADQKAENPESEVLA